MYMRDIPFNSYNNTHYFCHIFCIRLNDDSKNLVQIKLLYLKLFITQLVSK